MTETQPPKRQRAAVVLFVDSESGADEQDLAAIVKGALFQAGIRENGLTATIRGTEHHVRIVDVVEAGTAARNGYLWTGITSKAWSQRGL
ncbi:hypothetical protein [Arthrobacter mobilis]|uniref:Uncharacterized protein n=1 Tax=Arthrobacter mobilis TaxID=2724944 RepID=A0A7X6HH66_9MICC|nr:hypothetical protein [Arthrobacter mobilis]NKX55956.1 hypothetical protein [Arthrobacter mobilis]